LLLDLSPFDHFRHGLVIDRHLRRALLRGMSWYAGRRQQVLRQSAMLFRWQDEICDVAAFLLLTLLQTYCLECGNTGGDTPPTNEPISPYVAG
jgi:hypothetical protein